MFQKILLATDGSEDSMKAADYALQLAKVSNAEVEIVYVSPIIRGVYPYGMAGSAVNPEYIVEWEKHNAEESKKIIEQTAHNFDESGIKYTSKILNGDPADEICNEAEQEKIETIIMGCRGQGAVSRFLFGSVSSKVLTHAHCSVLIVR